MIDKLAGDHRGIPLRRRAKKSPAARKSLADAARLAELLASLTSVQYALDYEALIEASGSEIPAKLKAAMNELGGVLRLLVDEETADLTAADMLAPGGLRKRTPGVLGDAGLLAELLAELDALRSSDVYRTATENDGPLAVQMRAAVVDMLDDVLRELLGENKLIDEGKYARAGGLAKRAYDDVVKTYAPLIGQAREILDTLKRIEATPLPGGPARFDVGGRGRAIDEPPASSAVKVDVETFIASLDQEERRVFVEKLIGRAQANSQVAK